MVWESFWRKGVVKKGTFEGKGITKGLWRGLVKFYGGIYKRFMGFSDQINTFFFFSFFCVPVRQQIH